MPTWSVSIYAKQDERHPHARRLVIVEGTLVLVELALYPAPLERLREQTLRALAAAWGFELELRKAKP